jgi:ferredoxin-NADP reductase/Na+-translocating ferredoxin:NAD+ oxidoreductase RnfD subunit
MNWIDSLLERVSMYRLLVYYLLGLIIAAIVLSVTGYLTYNPLSIALSAGFMSVVAVIVNRVFAKVYQAQANYESSFITALILALIITPPTKAQDYVFLAAASGLAVASKYILAINKKHLFNPAAIAVVLTAVGPGQSASWWVGTATLAPFVLLGGVLVVRKTQRGQMVSIYLVSALVATTAFTLLNNGNVATTLVNTVLHSSMLFLAFVMLTEPLTSPTTQVHQRLYAVLVGVLLPPQIHIAGLFSTPELTLIAGNVYAYVVSSKAKLMLSHVKRVAWGNATHDFVFAAPNKFSYKPGQYMEFTLPHSSPDSRGTRRYFTLASSPTENNLRIGVKFYPKGSSYKKAMQVMTPASVVVAGQLGGDFVLPDDPSRKLAFIAGGIGITPFRSMIQYLIDNKDPRSFTLIYAERNAHELAYGDVFNAATNRAGASIVYTLTQAVQSDPEWMRRGYITAPMITEEIPDFLDRLFYISGPQKMVRETQAQLETLGVARHNIRVDFFPGYA